MLRILFQSASSVALVYDSLEEVFLSFSDERTFKSRPFNQQSSFRFTPKLSKKLDQAKNTKRATGWGLKKFDKWCEKRAIKTDLKTIAPKELYEILRIQSSTRR